MVNKRILTRLFLTVLLGVCQFSALSAWADDRGSRNSTRLKPIVSFECISLFSRLEHPALSDVDFEGVFIAPNESNPQDAEEILGKIPARGVMLAIGGERALFDYLLAKNKGGRLLAIDGDLDIIHFHQINSMLLRMAADGDLNQYFSLRMQPTKEKWTVAAYRAYHQGRLWKAELQILLDKFTLNWWQANIVANPKWKQFYTKPEKPGDPFFGVNYMFDVELFREIQNLTLADGYKTHFIDLRDSQEIKKLVETFKKRRLQISLLDLCNAWEDHFPNNYLGVTKTGNLLSQLSEVMPDDAVVMISFGKEAFKPMYYRGYSHRFLKNIVNQIEPWSKRKLAWADAAQTFEDEYNKTAAEFADGHNPDRAKFMTHAER